MDALFRFSLFLLLCGFIGASKMNDPCNPNPCYNGICIVEEDEHKINCLCDELSSGKFCEERLCSPLCEEDEICVLENGGNTCKKQEVPGRDTCNPNPCKNGGSCLPGDNGFICLCRGYYFGKICTESPCNPNPCLNNGTCKMTDIEDYSCTCPLPYEGDNCEEDSCSNYCEHDGECGVENGKLRCKCKEPYRGERCELRSCNPNPCKNFGVCEENGSNFECTCMEPFSGKLCEIAPCNPNPCRNFGICETNGTSFACVCKEPYIGRMCEKVSGPCNPNPCHNGVCLFDGKEINCLCDEFSFGQFCEKSPCDSNPCKNGGQCTNLDRQRFSCKCLPNYTGQTCELGRILIEIKAEVKLPQNSFGNFFQQLLTSRRNES